MATAAERIRQLELQPHPEGGYYREVFRAPETVDPGDGRGLRSALTIIYFLLPEGSESRWHRVRSVETWQFIEGAPLELLVKSPDESESERLLLGPLESEQEPLRVVPSNWWQSARSTGAYTLACCSVAPGFEFEDFELENDE
jgi:predicted cupin superfamily sugar epimerase